MQSFASNSQEMAMMTEDARDVTGVAADMHARAEALLNYSHAAVPSDYSAPGVKFVPTNIDELSGEQNFVGRVLTTNDPGKAVDLTTTTHIHRRRSRGGGQRGQLPAHLQTRGQTVSNAPPPFRRLSGMMPASTEKNRHI